MKFTKLLLLFCIFATFLTSAQNKEITLEDIWTGAFRTEGMDALHSMKNGQQYSVLNFDRTSGTTSIDVYDYKTLKKVKTLVNSNQLEAIPNFSDYTFSEDESNILLATDVTRIFRRSSLGTYYVYNTKTKDLSLVAEEQIQEPTFSPDGTKIAYGYKNNLFVKDLSSETTTQITFDGEKNKIINGITDWVYEEEFGFVRAFEWNAASDKIAFIRFDETQVPEFSMDVYGSALYPTQDVFKYPKAGEANALVSLHLYELKTDTVTEVKVNKDYTDFYIPRIKWTNDPDVLSAHYLNRHQNELDLWFIDAKNQTATLVLEERDVAYVDVTDNLTFLKTIVLSGPAKKMATITFITIQKKEI